MVHDEPEINLSLRDHLEQIGLKITQGSSGGVNNNLWLLRERGRCLTRKRMFVLAIPTL